MIMRRLLLCLLLGAAWPVEAQVTRDTTIYSATRIRTATNGNIVSVSVTKLAGIPAGKTDTVKQVIHDTVTVLRRDTMAWYPRVAVNPLHFTFDLVTWTGAGSKPDDVPFPSIQPTPGPTPLPIHDTVIVIKVRVDTVTVGSASARYFYWKPVIFGDSVRWALDTTTSRPSDVSSYPGNIRLPGPLYPWFWFSPAVRYDTVFFHLDSSRTRPLLLQSPPQPVILMRDVPGTAELPRVFMDTRMPVQPMSGDTLYQPVPGAGKPWACKGPTCATAAGRLKVLNAPRPKVVPTKKTTKPRVEPVGG